MMSESSLTRVRLRGGGPVVCGDLACVTPGSVIDEGRVAASSSRWTCGVG